MSPLTLLVVDLHETTPAARAAPAGTHPRRGSGHGGVRADPGLDRGGRHRGPDRPRQPGAERVLQHLRRTRNVARAGSPVPYPGTSSYPWASSSTGSTWTTASV